MATDAKTEGMSFWAKAGLTAMGLGLMFYIHSVIQANDLNPASFNLVR